MKGILRIFVAVIFLTSGFVKAIDPVGFSFKLEEYFSPTVFNLPFLEKIALPLSCFVIGLELFLGLMLLFNTYLKFTLKALIALCIFFAFLTFYSAYYNAVTDCGCFGDAIKFTPWQSFFKDIVLLISLIVLWFLYKNNKENKGIFYLAKPLIFMFFLLVFIFIYTMYVGMVSEPIVDFRDYKIGTNLNEEKQKINQNPDQYKSIYSLKNSKTGKEIQLNQDDYMNDDAYWKEGTQWVILEGKTTSKLVKEGYHSEILKFKLLDDQNVDFTDEILKLPKAILIFSYDPSKISESDKNSIHHLEDIITQHPEQFKDAKIFGVSNATNTFPGIKNLTMDGTAIKTIARSNPFVLTLQYGKITNKQPLKQFLNP